MFRLRPRTRRRISVWWQVLLAIIAFLLAASLGYNEWLAIDPDEPSPEGGLPRVPVAVMFALTGFVALGTLADKVVELRGGKKAVERERTKARVENVLAGLLVQLHEETGAPIRDLGVSVFANHATGGRIRIVRVARYRLDNSPLASKVDWQPGKGAVGQSWDTRRAIHRDWHLQLQHSSPDLSRPEFDGLPSGLTDGFTHAEFVGIANKYSEVRAFPGLSAAGDIVCVMSVDIAARAGLEDCVLNTDAVEGMVAASSRLILDDVATLDELE